MSNQVQVFPVSTRRHQLEFCRFPYKQYSQDPHWVAPLWTEEKKRWNPRQNPALAHVWQRRFLAVRNGQVVGRIAAIIDEEYSRRWFSGGGMFGFFESEDNEPTAIQLLAAAEESLRLQDKQRIVGPINLTTHDETGILVSGFDAPPTMLTPYNPNYYERLLRSAAYCDHSDYLAFRWTPQSQPTPLLKRVQERLKKQDAASIQIRSFRDGTWQDNIRIVHRLYNRSFDRTPGFVPIGWNDFQHRARQFRQFFRPELCLLAERDQMPVGFAIVLPDVNQALGRIDGHLLPWGWLTVARALPRIRRFRFVLLGVLPEYTGQNLSLALIDRALEVASQLGIETAELSLVHQQNAKVQRVIDAFGAQPHKVFRLFQKSLT